MKPVLVYLLGVAALGLAGFLSPWWFLGFLPVGVGLVWAAYDLVDAEVNVGDSPTAPPKRRA